MLTRNKPPSVHDRVQAILIGATVALAIGLAAGTSRAHGTEYTVKKAMPVAMLQVAADPVVIDEPTGWKSGDPAAIVVVGGLDREILRTRLIAELLAARVMVAELVIAPDLADPGMVVADAYATLDSLVAGMAPGMVLLYGFAWDVGGHGALLAAREEVKARLRAPGDAVFAAHASIGVGCRVETPNWDQPGEWRIAAIRQGEAIQASDDAPPASSSEAALACGIALVPAPWSNEALVPRAPRAAR